MGSKVIAEYLLKIQRSLRCQALVLVHHFSCETAKDLTISEFRITVSGSGPTIKPYKIQGKLMIISFNIEIQNTLGA